LYRVRVGAYRVIYEVRLATKLITIEHIRHRKDAYRDL
jgi:mRNA-degrading endonuclease RelE of RelBE toxin-antitoxin system